MSVESKLNRLSLDLRNNGLSPVSTKSSKVKKPKAVVADSWEDDASDSSTEEGTKSVASDNSISLEAPGPTHLKSPNTRAIDAEREMDENPNMDGVLDPPPPTPISPQMSGIKPDWSPARVLGGGRPGYTSQATSIPSSVSSPRSTPPVISAPSPRYGTPDPERKRPEKTTATANRLIAGALGIKAPPKTEEQRKYDRAVKEAEIRRKNKEKEAKEKEREEDEKAKKAVWDS